MIVIVDYGMGNLQSLFNAVRYLGFDVTISGSNAAIRDAAKLLLPGVGAFGKAMEAIRHRGLEEPLHDAVLRQGKPVLGICLGMQLMARTGEEHGIHEGLGWLDASVVRFLSAPGLKIPHTGWNDVVPRRSHPVFAAAAEERVFYFVHSYHMRCSDNRDVLATCRYGVDFVAAVARGNIVATQFHPEKSQDNGLQLLARYLEWNP